MLAIGEHDAVNIVRYFDDLPDPRSEVNRLHRVGDAIAISICEVVALADGPTAIAKWAKLNETWLRKHLALPHGIPSKDTFRRVLTLLNPILFQQCFSDWLNTLNLAADVDDSVQQRHIAIDGKTLRRSHDSKAKLGPLHVVSAWASVSGITLGQMATDQKSNEITAIPQLLDLIDIEDTIITIDAAGCQKNIAAKIIDKKADYVLALKGNQKKLFHEVRSLFDGYINADVPDRRVSRQIEVEQGHGRLESRTYYQMTAPGFLHGRCNWQGLRTIGAVVRVYEEDGVERSDTRYYISSLRRNAPGFANAVRSHWGVENSLHWSLDMTYREDESRVRERTFAENLAWLRRLTLSLIKQHPAKDSQVMKRRMAGWSTDFLFQVLTGKVT